MSSLHDIAEYELFTLTGNVVNVATLAMALLIALLAVIAAKLTEKGAYRFLTGRGLRDQGSAGATGRLVYYLVLALGLAIALDSLGVDLTALFAAGAFFAIALGFAMQNITQNFVSGVILLVERTIKPGDVIEVEGRMVRITQLGMRSTVVRTWDSEDYIIPNSILVANTVKNFTLHDRLYRIRCQVGVAYDSDLQQVRTVLEEAAGAIEWRVDEREPVVQLRGFGASSVDYDVSVWIDEPFDRSRHQSDLNEAVWFALKQAGIVIAFPQLDLHLDRRALDAMRGAAGGADESR